MNQALYQLIITRANRNKGELKMKKIISNQKGQGIMEYIILASLIGIFCLATVGSFGKVLKKRIEYMKEQITQNIKVN